MDFMRAAKYPTQDPAWVSKLLILFVSIFTIFAPVGYMVETVKRCMAGEKTLPEWSDFVSYWVSGLKLSVVLFVYNLPVVIIAFVVGIVVGLGASDQSAAAQAGTNLLVNAISGVLSLVITILMPALTISFMRDGEISSGFDFSYIISIMKANPMNYFMTLVFTYVFSFVASLSVLLCVLPCLIGIPWSYLATANLYGQLAASQAGQE